MGGQGRALQYVNIARDVPEDMRNKRVYLPSEPLCEVTQANIERFTPARVQLLDRADELADLSFDAINLLPSETRRAMRAACAVYLGIGKETRKALDEGRVLDRARSSKAQRMRTAWKACS
jgi:15-cis-phytoene synthase/lycopene beta-cyclase